FGNSGRCLGAAGHRGKCKERPGRLLSGPVRTGTRILGLAAGFHPVAVVWMRLTVRAVPNAKTSAILGWEEDPLAGRVLKVRIAAPAVDGKANAALTAFLAESLGLSRSKV